MSSHCFFITTDSIFSFYSIIFILVMTKSPDLESVQSYYRSCSTINNCFRIFNLSNGSLQSVHNFTAQFNLEFILRGDDQNATHTERTQHVVHRNITITLSHKCIYMLMIRPRTNTVNSRTLIRTYACAFVTTLVLTEIFDIPERNLQRRIHY